MNPAALAKAMKVRDYMKKHNIKPLIIYQEIQDLKDGTAVYIFQAKFKDRRTAEMFQMASELTAEMERELQEA